MFVRYNKKLSNILRYKNIYENKYMIILFIVVLHLNIKLDDFFENPLQYVNPHLYSSNNKETKFHSILNFHSTYNHKLT